MTSLVLTDSSQLTSDNQHLDPRVNQWSMMTSPFPTLAICLAYAYFAKVLGPRLMENRKPFNLRNVLIVYNFLQTIFSSWIFYEALHKSDRSLTPYP
uniref:Elongation of very long chain fatty acids protein n=1 Tax=Timema monikensis TaxID=170555 RepID=A0A7R9HI75_9NEOP|nr:unnamed protein product [Timema monikensis]